jgi:hypothetical protein
MYFMRTAYQGTVECGVPRRIPLGENHVTVCSGSHHVCKFEDYLSRTQNLIVRSMDGCYTNLILML